MCRFLFSAALHVLGVLTLLGLLGACSPEQNWRQIAFEGSTLKAQLPCKPDRTVRQVPLAHGVPVDLTVAGCESGAAMLAVMTAVLPVGSDPQAVLQGWQTATLEHLHARDAQRRMAWAKSGWLPLAASQQLDIHGRRVEGRSVVAHALWAAYGEGERVRVVHAVVYADQAVQDLAQGVFEGLQP